MIYGGLSHLNQDKSNHVAFMLVKTQTIASGSSVIDYSSIT